MFNPSDIYTESNFSNLFGCWTTPVTKFDTSSFYNWEQDNIPIVELEERTELLWERLGHPTSAVDGFSFVVSADATDECNSNIFTTLSGCLEKLPEVINSPYLIEVASYGDLGELKLSNKICGPNGSIEIINRNFSKAQAIGALTGAGSVFNTPSLYNGTYLASSVSSNSSYPIPGISLDLGKAKVYSINQTIASSTVYDDRLTNNLTIFVKNPSPYKTNRLTASLADFNLALPFASFSAAGGLVSFDPYDVNLDPSELEYDAKCILDIDGTELEYGTGDLSEGAASIAYANKLNKLSITNCNVPIYIRNFTVDGANVDYGIEINNSKVYLENFSVARCSKAGLIANNSDLILGRSFIAYRNYAFDSEGDRVGTPWLDKIEGNISTFESSELAAGIELNNTTLVLSSTYDRESEYEAQVLGSTEIYSHSSNPLSAIGVSSLPSTGWIFCLSRNDVGIKANNSKILGGFNGLNKSFSTGTSRLGYLDTYCMHLTLELNNQYGILSNNSLINFSGRLNVLGNFIGIESLNSDMFIDSLNVKLNQKQGLHLIKSKLQYNKDKHSSYTNLDDSQNKISQVVFNKNGTHIELDNSILEYTDTSGIPLNYGRFVALESFGLLKTTTDEVFKSPITIKNNSTLNIVHPALALNYDQLDTEYFNDGVLHGLISAKNNSTITLHGTKEYPTHIIGVEDYNNQVLKCGIFASDNSTVNIQGPTVIAKFGVDILVDNNSVLNITPQYTKDGDLAVSSFSLGDKLNHTIVELHSTRSCIVGNNNSVINFKDLGDYETNWGRSAYGQAALALLPDYDTEIGSLNYYTSGGSLQFYPNPNDSTMYSTYGIDNPSIDIYTSRKNVTGAAEFNYILTALPAASTEDLSSITNGGMCLRALNNTIVNVDNVHFPCGWWNASSVIYEADGSDGLCCRTFIWNIADLSKLNAKYVSVSGNHPGAAGYIGPSGVWASGAGLVASGAPSSTPDTSSLSILDYYGAASGLHRYASQSSLNYGPFRLYFSVNPVLNYGDTLAGGMDGYLQQVYSQGYQFSSNLIFSGTGATYYKSVQNPSGTNGYQSSGFYYASSMVQNPFTTRALLDDSGANTFANAKHNSVGKSGLAKTVDIYSPYTGTFGGDSVESTNKSRGAGIKSINSFDLEKLN